MSAGLYLAMLRDHIRTIGEHFDPREREERLMNTLTHMTAAIEKLLSNSDDKDKQIADLKAEVTASQNAPATGISDADATALISKIEAVTGPVADPEMS